MNPKVTFIVPTYKRPELLFRCLSSIKMSMKIEYEIIVIDDSQEGEGASAADTFSATYIKKSIFERRGSSVSRNIGLNLAKGEFIVFLDDDDFYVTDDMEIMIQNSNDCDMVCSNYFIYHNDNLVKVDIGGFDLDKMLVNNQLPIGSFAIRKSSIRYKFDEEIASHEDWDFLLRNLFQWQVKYFSYYPVAIDKSNQFTTSQSAQIWPRRWIEFLSIYAKYPCPRLKTLRSQTLNSMGLDCAPEMLGFEPYINQRVF